MAKNLWGLRPPKSEPPTSPFAILKTQAEALSSSVEYYVNGLVSGPRKRYDRQLECDLDIHARDLDDYIVSVVTVVYPLSSYPCTIQDRISGGPRIQCDDEKAFVAQLEKILSSTRVQDTIYSLLAQVHQVRG